MIDLSALAAELTQTRTVTVRGRDITLTPVSVSEWRRVRDLIVKPQPTKRIKDPTKGSNAPAILDETDPVYVAAYERWLRRVESVDLCRAMGVTVDGQEFPFLNGEEAPLGWADRAADLLARSFTNIEYNALARAIYSVEQAPMEEIVSGN